jgi:RNA polymerase sporulation-specific sigma factor
LSIEEAQLPDLESPESLLIDREDYKAFTDNIKLELSNMEYKVLQLFLDGKTYSEIADIMDITEKSVDNALSRIRKKIKSGD